MGRCDCEDPVPETTTDPSTGEEVTFCHKCQEPCSDGETKYAVGREYLAEDDTEFLTWEEVAERFPSLSGISNTGYRSDRTESLFDLSGFKPLAWTPNVRYLFYNPDKGILVKDVEGDLFIWDRPTEETIEEQVQEWPKAEVSLGEKYDSRFNWGGDEER